MVESVEEKRRAFTIFPPSFLCYNRITMDKLIKTISESGSFRAYVLDSTETVRNRTRKTQYSIIIDSCFGAYPYCQQILAANQKGESKIIVKLSGNSSFGHIISL